MSGFATIASHITEIDGDPDEQVKALNEISIGLVQPWGVFELWKNHEIQQPRVSAETPRRPAVTRPRACCERIPVNTIGCHPTFAAKATGARRRNGTH